MSLVTTTVSGYVYSNTAPVQGATINFKSNRTFILNNILVNVNKTVTSGANGSFSISLPRTSHDEETYITVTVSYSSSTITIFKRFNIDVTATSTDQRIEDLII